MAMSFMLSVQSPSVLSLGNCPVYLRRGDTIELMRCNDIYYFIVPIPSRPTTR